MLPWLWLVTALTRRHATVEAPGMALAAGSAIYVVLWFVAGCIDEVRIFMPYAMALIPLTCACAIERLSAGEGHGAITG